MGKVTTIKASAESYAAQFARRYEVSLASVLVVDIFLEQEVSATISLAPKPIFGDDSGILETEYATFKVNVLGLLDYYDCEVIEHTSSEVLGSLSYYFYFFLPKRKTGALIILRISDHVQTPHEGESADRWKDRLSAYSGNKAAKLTGVSRQKWKLKDIIINNKHYSDFDEAYDAIDRYLKRQCKK